MLDYVLGVAGVMPWRCGVCETRFHARMIPFQHLVHAHCAICGNLELKRISPEYVPGTLAFLGRLLHLPALRCEPCRHKFFSVLPMRRDAGRAATTTTE
jgi:hypothetical protein